MPKVGDKIEIIIKNAPIPYGTILEVLSVAPNPTRVGELHYLVTYAGQDYGIEEGDYKVVQTKTYRTVDLWGVDFGESFFGNYEKAFKKKECSCGAKHTCRPDYHLSYCDLYKEEE